ncbi:glycosyltransferase family 2 protein [uncultured Methanobrevibacter sp.]|uniref:glycosyltransferase family 2 protein n=1 Tax=uncultured Methanobrevibacter sp. TaxID=253161 RepID=UPI0025CD8823|nr:glycosyltransferase family 2 protein [uncultured Methanobrevibacter sp.]
MDSNDGSYKLTAIVLVYNGEPDLEPCLESLVNQTLDGLEILLINDASTDDSLSICRKYEMENDNVFVIDKEKNEGLAINANLGIGMAKGEYVILVDNDDIIPDYAYEKLYNKAKETDSDICIGKANFIVMGNQYEMSHYECSVWDDERVISDINEFPSIFHDAFYWNKIIRKDLLVENNIILPPGMIYADRSYSHNAYVKANRIAIIPDCVYMWRIGKDSLSSNRENISNYINKIESYQLDWKYISQYHKDYIKYLIRRILLPIQGIVHDNKFEEYYFTTVYDMLIDAKNLVDDIYDNDLNNLFNIYLYLTLNNERGKLKKLLMMNLSDCTEVIDENGKSYWNLPQFRNPEYGIPDEFFEIKFIENTFFKIDEVKANNDSIVFNNIELPKNYPIEKGYVVFKGLTDSSEIYNDNCLYFEIEKIENEGSIYRAEVPLDRLNIFERYEISFKSINRNQIPNEFRILGSDEMKLTNDNEDVQLTYSSDYKLAVTTKLLNDVLELDCSENTLRFKVNDTDRIKKKLNIYIKNDHTHQHALLSLDENGECAMDWKFFLDNNSNYSFIINVFKEDTRLGKEIPLNRKLIRNFKNQTFKNNEDINITIYESSGNVKLKTN